ncbi:hypothetical protein [Magnetovirga frankeli]
MKQGIAYLDVIYAMVTICLIGLLRYQYKSLTTISGGDTKDYPIIFF